MTEQERLAQDIRECDDAYTALLGRALVAEPKDYGGLANAIMRRKTEDALAFEAWVKGSAEYAALHPPTPPAPEHVDPSGIPLTQLARIRGSMWTARCNIPFGPRPGKDDNILAMDYYEHYGAGDRSLMLSTYTGLGYTHAVTGPLVDPDGYHGSYPLTPNLPTPAEWDAYLDAMQEWWDAGITPIHFCHPDGWSLEQMAALEPFYLQPRAQKLLRIVVPSGWEPAKYEWSSQTWAEFMKWGRRIFPNALILLHTVPDVDAPVGTDARGDDNGKPNADGWKRVAPHIHGWLVQSSAFAEPDAHGDTNHPEKTNFDNWADLFDSRQEKSYPNRFRNGYAGWPMGSLWGANTSIKIIAAEYGSWWAFWKNRPHSEACAWGDRALSVGADGVLDGCSLSAVIP